MALKEIIASAILSTSSDISQQKTVCDELSSCQKIVHQVMESKENPYKIDENIMTLALKVSEKNPIKYDISKLPHTAQLSQDKMKYYFQDNGENVPDFTPSKTGEIDENYKPEIYGNLQYLIGETGVLSYLNLSPEHQKVIQYLANILLTDKYAENIEVNKQNNTRNFDIVSSGEKDLKTSSLGLTIKKVISLLQDIQEVRSGVMDTYNLLNKTLKKYEEKKGYNPDPKLYELLENLKPEIESVEKIHELLKKEDLEKEMDLRKKEEVILLEIKKIKGEVGELKGEVLELESKVGELEREVGELKDKVEEKDNRLKGRKKKLRELDKYLKTLNRFLDKNGRSQ